MCAGTAFPPLTECPALTTPTPRSQPKPSLQRRALAYGQFLLSAAGVSVGVHFALMDAWLGGLLFGGALLVAAPQLRARRRMRKLLSSGDLEAILDVWSATVEELPNYRTTAPLARATALIAHGLTAQATQSLDRAVRGSAWDRAIEHRLFVETLVDAFNGHTTQAMDKAQTLRALPLPASLWARSRANTLRHGAEALARTFAHCSKSGDLRKLSAAGQDHPLVHWAMRYARVVGYIDRGKFDRALRLLDPAPEWKKDSVFHAFQIELLAVAKSRRLS